MVGLMPDPTKLSEADWQRRVTDACRRYGVMYHHCRPARRESGGYSTPIEGHAGFPDLVLCWPDGYVLLVELKSDTGRLSPQQVAWLDRLGNMAEVWRPRQWDHVLTVLSRKAAA
jgi:hypothetical protein